MNDAEPVGYHCANTPEGERIIYHLADAEPEPLKLKKWVNYQCSAIVQPGEYVIDRWDNKQCEEKNPYRLIKCKVCEKYFCILHWSKHDMMTC